MAFVKKFTRRIMVNGEIYLWYFRDNSLESRPRRIAVQHSVARGQMLVVSPWSGPYTLSFDIRPRAIRELILFGLTQGWKPSEKAPPLILGHDDGWQVFERRSKPYHQNSLLSVMAAASELYPQL